MSTPAVSNPVGTRDSRAKLYLTWRCLSLRSRLSEVFKQGSYVALSAAGDRTEHVCAFARSFGEDKVIAIAPRLIARLTGEQRVPLGAAGWGETSLELPAAGTFRDELTGRSIEAREIRGKPALALADVLEILPVSLLVSV